MNHKRKEPPKLFFKKRENDFSSALPKLIMLENNIFCLFIVVNTIVFEACLANCSQVARKQTYVARKLSSRTKIRSYGENARCVAEDRS